MSGHGKAAARDYRDRGSGTLAAMVAACLILCAGLLLWAMVEAVLAHHRASVAADLSAIAGASRMARGGEDPCGIAGDIAGANGATLIGCQVEGSDLVVTVEVPAPALLARLAPSAGQAGLRIHAMARAGRP